MNKALHDRSLFQRFATRVSCLVGSSRSFLTAGIVVLIWGLTGPLFHYSDTWQLWINTGTTIVTFLMVFLIQYTQNRDATAMHLKIDELLRAVQGARIEMADLKDVSDEDLQHLERAFSRLARFAASKGVNVQQAISTSAPPMDSQEWNTSTRKSLQDSGE